MIAEISSKSILWNKNVFGNIFNRKKHHEARINGVQMDLNYHSLRDLQILDRSLIKELNEVLVQEKAHWFQKSRQDWVKDGDKNTRFYHNAAF